jgi:hypothetical protein
MEKAFPMCLWDRLLHQAVITINMLRTSQINTKLSASTHIDGQYNSKILINLSASMQPASESRFVTTHLALILI